MMYPDQMHLNYIFLKDRAKLKRMALPPSSGWKTAHTWLSLGLQEKGEQLQGPLDDLLR